MLSLCRQSLVFQRSQPLTLVCFRACFIPCFSCLPNPTGVEFIAFQAFYCNIVFFYVRLSPYKFISRYILRGILSREYYLPIAPVGFYLAYSPTGLLGFYSPIRLPGYYAFIALLPIGLIGYCPGCRCPGYPFPVSVTWCPLLPGSV